MALTAKLFGFAAGLWLGVSGAASAAEALKLGFGDILSFGIVGLPELQRDIQIDPAGNVFLPLVGELPAANMTLPEFRASVREALRTSPIRLAGTGGEGSLRSVQANELVVTVASYRPVYVMGAVENVGAVEFRPGMTVRQAIAVAGGLRIFDENTDLRALDLMARRNLYVAQVEIAEQKLARLFSDLEQLRGGAVPELAAESGGSSDLAPLAEVAEDWLEARAQQRDRSAEGRLRQLDQMKNRLDVLRKLQGVNEETVKIEEDNLSRVQDLVDRGRSTASALDDARGDVLQSSSRALETAGEAFRVEIDIARAQSDMEIDSIDEGVELLAEIERTRGELLQLDRQVEFLNGYLRILGASAPVSGDSEVSVQLNRSGSDAPFEGEVGQDETVLPGDVINIELSSLPGR